MAIGRGGHLLWRLPDDMAHFKAETMGGTVIMGRKTWGSIGRPLPGRTNIVVSRSAGLILPPGVLLKSSLQEAIASSTDKCFIIGGGQIYAEAMEVADELNLTFVGDSPADADTFFPEINPLIWAETYCSESRTDEKAGVAYTFRTFKRKNR